MKRVFLLGVVISIPALAIAGCGGKSSPAAQPIAAAAAAAGIADPQVRPIEVPAAAGSGQPREVKVLVDEPALELVSIVLRGGTVLPEHHAEVPVVIQAVHGAGTVTAGGQELRLDATHAVVLGAKVPHAVAPAAGTDLVLLVHHLGRAAHHHDEGEH